MSSPDIPPPPPPPPPPPEDPAAFKEDDDADRKKKLSRKNRTSLKVPTNTAGAGVNAPS